MRKYLQGLLGAPHIGQNQKQTELGKGLVMAWRHLTVMRGPAIEGSAAEAAREAPPGGKGTSEQDRKYTTQPGANCRQTLPWQGPPWKGLTDPMHKNMNHKT